MDMEAIITSAGLVSFENSDNPNNFTFVLGSVIPCVALVWLAYISKGQHTLALVLLNVAIGTNAVYLYGSLINHVDLSPKYAGVLISIENTISQAISMFGPVFIQHVVTDLVSCINQLVCCLEKTINLVNYRQLKSDVFVPRNLLTSIFCRPTSSCGGRFSCPCPAS